jgi:hypothetical protein
MLQVDPTCLFVHERTGVVGLRVVTSTNAKGVAFMPVRSVEQLMSNQLSCAPRLYSVRVAVALAPKDMLPAAPSKVHAGKSGEKDTAEILHGAGVLWYRLTRRFAVAWLFNLVALCSITLWLFYCLMLAIALSHSGERESFTPRVLRSYAFSLCL